MPCRLRHVGDHRARVGGVARPVHRRPAGGQRRLERQQVLVEVGERVVLDAGRPLPQRLPVVDLAPRPRPAWPGSCRSRGPGCGAAGCRPAPRGPRRGERRHPQERRRGRRAAGRGRPVDSTGSTPLRLVGRGRRRAPRPGASCGCRPAAARAAHRRASGTRSRSPRAPPPRWSARARPCPTPSPPTSRQFFTANVPPNPQHSSARGSGTRSIPRTAASSRVGRSPTRSIRSEWQVGW